MRMVIVGRGKISQHRSSRFPIASQLFVAGLLSLIAFVFPIRGQSAAESKTINWARSELDNGNYSKAIELARNVADGPASEQYIVSALETILASQIAQEQYQEGRSTLARYLNFAATRLDQRQKARAHLRASDFYRSERKFPEALRQTKHALEATPNDLDILARYHLSLGRILFSSGYDLAAIIWLEKAERFFEGRPVSEDQLETYRFLSLAWSAKLNYPAALRYSKRLTAAAEGSRYKNKYRQALFEEATLLSSVGQYRKASELREKGLTLSRDHKNTYHARKFLASMLLNALYENDVAKSSSYLEQLSTLDSDSRFTSLTTLGSAIIAAFEGRRDLSEKIFTELEKQENRSPFILPSWRVTIAERNKEWQKVIRHNQTLLDLALAQNYREDLPGIYLSLARAHFHLGQVEESNELLRKNLSLVEEIRNTENRNLSLGLLETYHKAYRLLAQTKLEVPQESFELSDHLKARLLKDRTTNTPTKDSSIINPDVRRKLELLSLDLIESPSVASEISKIETSFTWHIPTTTIPRTEFSELDRASELDNSAVVSYLFTLDERLIAFVWEKGKPIRSVYLPSSEPNVVADVSRMEQKIKNRIFFKRDGKELFDRLLKPLNISATHLIIVPDKQLWKIPFQALSPDGEKYLIEDKVVSYAPSVAILIEQLKAPKPARLTLQAFANSSFNNQLLRYVNDESIRVAGMFNSRPAINATIADFTRFAGKSDILHFSMHAQVDNDQPLDSFLALKGIGKDDGRLTVAEIMESKLKKGSLVFLASCDTNNVLSGEGLVSLAWGMMGAGATTVVSAQWQADDRLSKSFSTKFYAYYKSGNSTADSIRKTSIDLIKDKTMETHEPYYWANFNVIGDFR